MLSDTVGEHDNRASEWSALAKGSLSHQSIRRNVFELCVNILIPAFCAAVPFVDQLIHLVKSDYRIVEC